MNPQWSENHDNGEWEFGLYEFDEMCNIIFMIIGKISPKEVSEQMIDDILFGIARDNECNSIVRELLEYPEWYSLLCKKALSTDYINAKWQFAESLKDYNGREQVKELIFEC